MSSRFRCAGTSLLIETNVRRGGYGGLISGVGSGAREPIFPRKLDELLLELVSERDDCVDVVGPDNHNTFITLRNDETESRLHEY